jgi:hypothetical protein
MNIYTFYAKIEDSIHEDQLRLINIWKKSWSYYGWNPVVIYPEDLINKRQYNELKTVCTNFPTVNHTTYELYCFLRWLSLLDLGGWFTDYDVINYGFEPLDYDNKIVTTTFQIGGSTVYGPKSFYENVISTIINYKPDETDVTTYSGNIVPHISDLTLLLKTMVPDIRLNIEKCYTYDGYDTAKLVHYGNAYIPKTKTRFDIIEEDKRSTLFLKN